MKSHAKLARARNALARATDSDAWVRAVFRLMLATAPGAFASAALRCAEADAALWITSTGVEIHAAEMPEVITAHPGVGYLMAHPGLKVLPTRGVLPPQEALEGTLFYEKFMKGQGWRHAVGLCFWRKEGLGVECVMSVNRSEAEGDFSEAEIAALGALHQEIDQARWRVTALDAERSARSSYEHFAQTLPLPIALLDWTLEPRYHNRAAREACAQWAEGKSSRQRNVGRHAFVAPPEVLEACRELQAEWRERIRSDALGESVLSRRVTQPGGGGLSATVRLVYLTGSSLGDPPFLVEFQTAGTAGEGKPPSLSALQVLSPAERSAVILAGAFKSNAEIAAELGLSVGTVKAELHGAYKKLGVRTRAELISRLERR